MAHITTSQTAPNWLTLSDAARRAGVAHRTMRGWADRGLVECFRTPGGHRRIDAGSLSRMLMSRSDSPPAPPAARGRVLVVEHDATARGLVRQRLEHAGFEVVEASNAIDGLNAINGGLPAQVVLDVHLPGMDGWEMLRRIRSRLDAARLPVVLYSGRVTMRPGAVPGAVVHRPFEPAHVVDQVIALAAAHS